MPSHTGLLKLSVELVITIASNLHLEQDISHGHCYGTGYRARKTLLAIALDRAQLTTEQVIMDNDADAAWQLRNTEKLKFLLAAGLTKFG